MSRIANTPIPIPGKVEVSLSGDAISVKGNLGQLNLQLHQSISLSQADDAIIIQGHSDQPMSKSMRGTTASLVKNMLKGVSVGFEKKLVMVGVGYRASMKGGALDIQAGFSHPVLLNMPEGITVETPSQTEIIVKGIDKQLVGQVAANIRAVRPPEPYKGKGIRYANEYVRRKEGKKK